MADTPSRRAMLAGMAAIPALAVTACPAPAPAASAVAFDAAVRRLIQRRDACEADRAHGTLRAAYDLHRDRVASFRAKYGDGMVHRAPEPDRAVWAAANREVCAAEDAHYERFTRLRVEAAEALCGTPAPTLAHLCTKIDLLSAEYDGCGDDWQGDAIFADVKRLAGEGR